VGVKHAIVIATVKFRYAKIGLGNTYQRHLPCCLKTEVTRQFNAIEIYKLEFAHWLTDYCTLNTPLIAHYYSVYNTYCVVVLFFSSS
jgi:hypothetical protein